MVNDIIDDTTAATGDSATSKPIAPTRESPFIPKKLLLSKWTVVLPTDKEKHFVVARVVVPDSPALRAESVEIEAVHSGRSSMLPCRQFADGSLWRHGWIRNRAPPRAEHDTRAPGRGQRRARPAD